MNRPHAKPEPPKGWRDRLAALRNVPPLLRMVWDTSPFITLTSLILRLVSSLAPLGFLWVGKLIVDHVVSTISGHPLHPEDPHRIWRLLAIEFSIAVGTDLMGRAKSLCDSLLGDRFTNHVSLKLMQHATRLDLFAFEDPAFYDKMERARRETTSRLGMLASLAVLVQQFITLLTLSAGLIYFAPWLLVLLIVAVVPSFIGETNFSRLGYSLLYRWTPERRELDYLRMLGASQQSAKEVKIFGLGDYLTERSRRLFERFYAENRKLALQRALTGSLLNLLPTAGYYTAYAYILGRALTGSLSVGELTFLTGAISRSRDLIEGLFSGFSSISEQALYIRDLFDFFEMKPTIVSTPDSLPVPRPIRRGFEFRDVGFRYPGADRWVLQNVNFRLEPEQKIALIGENGAGKTTLVKLLARLYDPTEGVILLDGVDLREYNVEELRREIGVIFQDYMRYDMLAKENIGVGRIEEFDNQPRIEASAHKSLADSVIDQFPTGYNQMLGRRFDGGVDLSAGQWQKIALGRAYMRDAQLLILDEPTASLDARAEYEVFLRFSDLTQGKMAILISHRFSTVRMANQILVLENGAIREQGTHQQLVALGGRYAELFELQAAGYR